jgi:hypothetical protein
MAYIFRLEHEDGTPTDPPTLRTAVPDWHPSDTIPLGRWTLRVVAVRDDGADQAPVLVVENTAPTGHKRRPVLVIRCERAGSGVGAMAFGSAPGPLIVCASFGRDQHLHRQTLRLRSVAGLLPSAMPRQCAAEKGPARPSAVSQNGRRNPPGAPCGMGAQAPNRTDQKESRQI